jgi:DNA polymerase-3 subunit alpha (Gram-positive type)
LCFIDLETTGLGKDAQIVEIACNINGLTFQSLVKPSIRIPDDVIKIHGITNEMVENSPSIKEVIIKFNEFIHGYENLYFVGHNFVRFDLPLLRNAYKSAELAFPHVKFLDTLNLSEWYYPDVVNHRLQTMCVHLKVQVPNHRALQDVQATKELFEKMEQEHKFRY